MTDTGIRSSTEPKRRKNGPEISGVGTGRLRRLFLREERQIHVHDNAEEYGNAADDRHQLQEDSEPGELGRLTGGRH